MPILAPNLARNLNQTTRVSGSSRNHTSEKDTYSSELHVLINVLVFRLIQVAMWFIAFIWFPRTQGLALVNQPSAPTQSAVVIERAFDMRRPSRGQPLTAAWKLQEAYTRAERAEAGLAVPPWVGASASPRAGAHRQHEQTAATPRAPGKGSVSTDAAQYKLSLPKGRDKHHR